MLCPKCGYYAERDENVCPSCGNILSHPSGIRAEGAQSIRQGKRARESAKARPVQDKELIEARKRRSGASHATVEMPTVRDERFAGNDYFDSMTVSEQSAGPSMERRRRAFYDEYADPEQAARYAASHDGEKYIRKRMINWIKLSMVIVCLVVILVAGIWGYLRFTPSGQLVVTRTSLRFPNLNLTVSSSSLWTVGEEYMDKGQIQSAIRCFEMAKKMNEDEKVFNVEGLLTLGSAYEAADRLEDAEALYEMIYTETPTRSEAYKAHIRILQSSEREGDLKRAGELMKIAYEKTKETIFQNQRDDFLPKAPQVDLTAAYYEKKENITLSSIQGFDIYYTFDPNAVLPVDGFKFKGPIPLDEGSWSLRAVCVNGELVSDELRGTYRISMPSPKMPQCNLAPNTYKTSQTVRLKPGKDNINDDDIVIYYTIDGSPPNLDSPVYRKNEQIRLPNGNVTLQAIAVNQYQKISNPLVVKYKITANPQPQKVFTNDDMLTNIRFGLMTQLEFFETYGESENHVPVETEEYSSECRRYDYPWGYVIMNLAGTKKNKTWVVVEISYTVPGKFTAPRKTGIGDSEKDVTDQFRDCGQVESEKKNRGLYFNDKGSGKVWYTDKENRTIRYIYKYDGHTLQLDYDLKNNSVIRIDMKYIP